MTRLRAALWALFLLAIAFPSVSGPVLAAAVEGVRWLGGQPTLLLTLTAAGLAAWALYPRRTTTGRRATA